MEVSVVTNLACGYKDGKYLLEMPSVDGGIFVDDETLALAAQMELVLELFTNNGRKQKFYTDLLQVLARADEDKEDPIEAVTTWLNAWMDSA